MNLLSFVVGLIAVATSDVLFLSDFSSPIVYVVAIDAIALTLALIAIINRGKDYESDALESVAFSMFITTPAVLAILFMNLGSVTPLETAAYITNVARRLLIAAFDLR
ncbi:hypothetical protein [Pyrobaculum islandicum]|uniref:hypothetical protein n=1 Tax=Pyrobaculum islandicum TaxID=2277 RepID=UPI00069EF573|nr:hypothetical protein [Pyrobaculum islandicum]